MYQFTIFRDEDTRPYISGKVPMLLPNAVSPFSSVKFHSLISRLQQDGVKPVITTQGIMWTEADGAPHRPSRLIINTKPARHVFEVPTLMFMEGRYTVLSAMQTEGGSGVLRDNTRFTIFIEHQHA